MDILIIMRILNLLTVTAMVGLTSPLHAEDIQAERGKVYRNCDIISKDKHGVMFRHSGGVARIAYTSMPTNQQQHFGYQKPQAQVRSNARVVTTTNAHSNTQNSRGTTYVYQNGNRSASGYGTRFQSGQRHVYMKSGHGYRPVYVNRAGSTNPNFRTTTLSQIINYRNNGYSNITYAGLYNQHFNTHAASHYRGTRNNIVQVAPRYLSYVRNIYPRQIGTFNYGPSGGSLIPSIRSGYSTAGSIAPSLVPSSR